MFDLPPFLHPRKNIADGLRKWALVQFGFWSHSLLWAVGGLFGFRPICAESEFSARGRAQKNRTKATTPSREQWISKNWGKISFSEPFNKCKNATTSFAQKCQKSPKVYRCFQSTHWPFLVANLPSLVNFIVWPLFSLLFFLVTFAPAAAARMNWHKNNEWLFSATKMGLAPSRGCRSNSVQNCKLQENIDYWLLLQQQRASDQWNLVIAERKKNQIHRNLRVKNVRLDFGLWMMLHVTPSSSHVRKFPIHSKCVTRGHQRQFANSLLMRIDRLKFLKIGITQFDSSIKWRSDKNLRCEKQRSHEKDGQNSLAIRSLIY